MLVTYVLQASHHFNFVHGSVPDFIEKMKSVGAECFHIFTVACFYCQAGLISGEKEGEQEPCKHCYVGRQWEEKYRHAKNSVETSVNSEISS